MADERGNLCRGGCPVYFLVILDVFTAKVVRIFDPYTEVAARPLHGALTAGY